MGFSVDKTGVKKACLLILPFHVNLLFTIQALHESLYRVETGNYDYRFVKD